MNNDLNVLLKIVNAPAFFPSLHNQKIDYDYDQTYVLNLTYVMVMQKKSCDNNENGKISRRREMGL